MICRTMISPLRRFQLFFLYPDHRDLGEAFVETPAALAWPPCDALCPRGRRGRAAGGARCTHQRHIEEHRVNFVAVILRQLDPVLAFLRSEIRGVHIIHRTLRDQPRLEHRAQVGEHEILKTLLAHIVEKK